MSENERDTVKERSGRKTQTPPKPLQQIVKDASERLDLPIGTGKITNRNANGVFKQRAKVVRLRVANDLPTLAHEIGHYFDSMHNFSEANEIDEVIEGIDRAFLEQYPSEQHPSEAFAEFVRIYMTNKETARRRFPKFTVMFEENIRNTDDYDNFIKTVNDIHNYMTLSVNEKMNAAIMTRKAARRMYAPSLSEKSEEFRREWVDVFAPIQRVTDYVSDTLGRELTGSTIAGGIFDVGFNRDFKGSPIVSKTYENLPKAEQYNGRTSFISVQIGSMTNQSPLEIDHLIKSSAGILGTIYSNWTAVDPKERHLIAGTQNAFTADANYSTDIINRAYTKADKAADKFKLDPSAENAVNSEKTQLITSYASGMSKAIKALPYEEQSAARAQMLATIKAMQQSEGIAPESVLRKFKDDTVPDNYILTKYQSSMLERTKNKKKESYQMSPDEYTNMIAEMTEAASKTRKEVLNKSNMTNEEAAQSVRDAVNEVKSKYKKKHDRDFK